MEDKKRGIGLRFAIDGLKTVFKSERNFQIHVIAFITVLLCSLIFQLTFIEWCFIIIVSCLVFILEIMNSVIELTIDYLNPTIHPTVKKIKDMSASAVLVATICAIIIGLIIFIPKLIKVLN